MYEPLVSIIIPVYNSEKYLDETIRSAIQQTWPNKEIIVVDDGSTDNSLSIAIKYQGQQLKVFVQENKGASAARNKGLAEAKGEYIQFLDADDLLSKNKIESQITELIRFPNSLGLCCTVHFYDGNDPFGQLVKHEWNKHGSDDPVDFLIKLYGGAIIGPEYGGMIQTNAWLTPISIIREAGNWNEKLSLDDDGEYFCRVILASKTIIYAPKAVNYYRKYRANPSLSAGNDLKAMQSALIANELKYKHLKDKSNNPQIDAAFARLFMENAVTFYPKFKDLYLIANKRVQELGGTQFVPAIGGRKIEIVKNIFGWRFAKFLQFVMSRLLEILRTKDC